MAADSWKVPALLTPGQERLPVFWGAWLGAAWVIFSCLLSGNIASPKAIFHAAIAPLMQGTIGSLFQVGDVY